MRRRNFRRGLSLTEVMVSVMILALTVIVATALFPMAAFLRDRAGAYSRASSILQRKLEQIRRLPQSRLTYSGLHYAGVIDPGGSPYSFTTVDNLGSQLGSGAGGIVLSTGGTDVTRADVTITWRGLRGTPQTLTATTLVSSREVWVQQ